MSGRSSARARAARSRPAPRPLSPALVEGVCAALAALALYPLLTPGHLWGHDTGAHLFRLAEVARALREGIFYPRFVPDAYGGLGGPILNFNPVAPYYAPALLVLAGFGPIAALKITAGAMMIAGGVALRILARPHVGRIGAAVAGLAYVFLPYRIANLYVRMAFSEIAAMVILPLAMAAAGRAARRPTRRRVALAGAAIGALLATHFPASVLGIPLVAVYALWSARRGGHLRAAGAFALILAMGLSLGAFSWLPALLEQSQTHYEDSTSGYDNYRNHFLEAAQLVSPRWGFGPSMPGSRDGMSFQIGWAHLLALAALVASAAAVAALRSLALFCTVVVAGGSFMMLGASRPIWDLLPTLQNVQFPWRILMLTGVATSLAAGAAATLPPAAVSGPGRLRKARPRRFAPALTILVLVGACVPYLEARRGEGKDGDFTPEAIRGRYFGELKFQPREVQALRFSPEGPRALLLGGGEARIAEEGTHRAAVEIDAPAPATLRLHLFYLPGWRARIGGQDLPIRGESGTGLVLVDVPAGRHRVTLWFGDTPVRRAGWILSGIGVLVALYLVGPSRRHRAAPGGPS